MLRVDDLSVECIDPQLLHCSQPADDTPLGTRDPSTVDSQPDLGIFSYSATDRGAHLDKDHTAIVPEGRKARPPTPVAPARSAGCARCPARPRGGNKHTCAQNDPPRYKKRRARAIATFTHRPLYHSLPAADREYLDRVVANLRGAAHLASPQTLEPTVGSPVGFRLVGPRRSAGTGRAADHESVYAILIDRPPEGAYVCWLCGEKRAGRRLPRALDHIRGHFEHRPYHCSEVYFDQRTGSSSLPPSACVW